MPHRHIALITTLLGLFSLPALAAPSIEKLTLTPAQGARVGDRITAQIDFADVGSEGICGVELEFGDGRRETFKIKPDTKLPIIVEHVFRTAGEPTVRAAGNRVENALSCNGKQIIMYKVAPAPVAAAPVAMPATCPADWTLKGKIARNGAFTCVPKKGVKAAKKPEQPLACPTGTSYFTKGKTLGCEKS